MASESIIKQIVKSLSFEVEATRQNEEDIQAPSTSNMTPLNVKIKVRKKHESKIEKGVLSVRKLDNPDGAPERIRLISSDQTIMSFNILMEADFVEKKKRRSRKYFFGGCLGTQYDEDDGPYRLVPGTINDDKPVNKRHSECSLKEKLALSKNRKDQIQPVLQLTKHGVLGYYKPGGCLDPPFGEDKYTYKPVSKDKLIITNIPKSETEEEKSNKTKKTKDKCSKTNAIKNIDENSLLSLENNGQLKDSLDKKYSDSLITYPPEVSSTLNTNDKVLRTRNRSEEKQMRSFSEGSGTFYKPARESYCEEYKEPKTIIDTSSNDISKGIPNHQIIKIIKEKAERVPDIFKNADALSHIFQNSLGNKFDSSNEHGKGTSRQETNNKDDIVYYKKYDIESNQMNQNDTERNSFNKITQVGKIEYEYSTPEKIILLENSSKPLKSNEKTDTPDQSFLKLRSDKNKGVFKDNLEGQLSNIELSDYKNAKLLPCNDENKNIALEYFSPHELQEANVTNSNKNISIVLKTSEEDMADRILFKDGKIKTVQVKNAVKPKSFTAQTSLEELYFKDKVTRMLVDPTHKSDEESNKISDHHCLISNDNKSNKDDILSENNRYDFIKKPSLQSSSNETKQVSLKNLMFEKNCSDRTSESNKSVSNENFTPKINETGSQNTKHNLNFKATQDQLVSNIIEDANQSFESLDNTSVHSTKVKSRLLEAYTSDKSKIGDDNYANQTFYETAYENISTLFKESTLPHRQSDMKNEIGSVNSKNNKNDSKRSKNNYLSSSITTTNDQFDSKYVNEMETSMKSEKVENDRVIKSPKKYAESWYNVKDYDEINSHNSFIGPSNEEHYKLSKNVLTDVTIHVDRNNFTINENANISVKESSVNLSSSTIFYEKSNTEKEIAVNKFLHDKIITTEPAAASTDANISIKEYSVNLSSSTIFYEKSNAEEEIAVNKFLNYKVNTTEPTANPTALESNKILDGKNNEEDKSVKQLLSNSSSYKINIISKNLDTLNGTVTKTLLKEPKIFNTISNEISDDKDSFLVSFPSDLSKDLRSEIIFTEKNSILDENDLNECRDKSVSNYENTVSLIKESEHEPETKILSSKPCTDDDLKKHVIASHDDDGLTQYKNHSLDVMSVKKTFVNVTHDEKTSPKENLSSVDSFNFQRYPTVNLNDQEKEGGIITQNIQQEDIMQSKLLELQNVQNISNDYTIKNSHLKTINDIEKPQILHVDSSLTSSNNNNKSLAKDVVSVPGKLSDDPINTDENLGTTNMYKHQKDLKIQNDLLKGSNNTANDLTSSPMNTEAIYLKNKVLKTYDISLEHSDVAKNVPLTQSKLLYDPIKTDENFDTTNINKHQQVLKKLNDKMNSADSIENELTSRKLYTEESYLKNIALKTNTFSLEHSDLAKDVLLTSSKLSDDPINTDENFGTRNVYNHQKNFENQKDKLKGADNTENYLTSRKLNTEASYLKNIALKTNDFFLEHSDVAKDVLSTPSKLPDVPINTDEDFATTNINKHQQDLKKLNDKINGAGKTEIAIPSRQINTEASNLKNIALIKNDFSFEHSDIITSPKYFKQDKSALNVENTTDVTKSLNDIFSNKSVSKSSTIVFTESYEDHRVRTKTEYDSSISFHKTFMGTITTSPGKASTASLKSSLKNEVVSLDIGFQSYKNEKKERIIKTFDTSKEPLRRTDDIVTFIRAQIRPQVNDIRIPVDSDNEMTIQIQRSKSPMRVQIQNSPQLGDKMLTSKFCTGNKFTGTKLQGILDSIYERDLIPLQRAFKYLKRDVDMLAAQQSKFKDKTIVPRSSKSIRIIKVNPKCCCWNKY